MSGEEEEQEEGREKFTLSITTETDQWLRESYPDGMSQQERVRMAISDAREARTDRD